MITIKNNIFHKLFAFGCSYTFGAELPEHLMFQTPYFKNNEYALKLYNDRKKWNGSYTILSDEERTFWNELAYNDYNNPLEPYDFWEGKRIYTEMCHKMAYPGVLAQKLNINNYVNYSQSGLSNIGMLINLIRVKDCLDENTLVIIGLTHSLRKLRFWNNDEVKDVLGFTEENIDKFLHFNTFDHAHKTVEKYLQRVKNSNHNFLDIFPVDDDSIIQELHCVYECIDICEQMGCSYIIYDTFGKVSETIPSLLNYLNDHNLNQKVPSLYEIVNKNEIPGEYLCFCGHPNHLCHEQVAELMYEKIVESKLYG